MKKRYALDKSMIKLSSMQENEKPLKEKRMTETKNKPLNKKKKISVQIESKKLTKFKRWCFEHNTTMSKEIMKIVDKNIESEY